MVSVHGEDMTARAVETHRHTVFSEYGILGALVTNDSNTGAVKIKTPFPHYSRIPLITGTHLFLFLVSKRELPLLALDTATSLGSMGFIATH